MHFAGRGKFLNAGVLPLVAVLRIGIRGLGRRDWASVLGAISGLGLGGLGSFFGLQLGSQHLLVLLDQVDGRLDQPPRVPGVVVVGEQALRRTPGDVRGRLGPRGDCVREAQGRLVGAAQEEVAHPAQEAGHVAVLGLWRHLRLVSGLVELFGV